MIGEDPHGAPLHPLCARDGHDYTQIGLVAVGDLVDALAADGLDALHLPTVCRRCGHVRAQQPLDEAGEVRDG